MFGIPEVPEFEQKVIAFKEAHRFEVNNFAHLVLEDENYDDSAIQVCLDFIASGEGPDYMRRENITKSEADEVIAFLHWMLTIPEDEREGVRDMDEEE